MARGTERRLRDTEKISPVAKSLLHQNGMLWESANLPSNGDARGDRGGRDRSLLVPLDGTSVAEHALPHALAIARRTDAVVRLVHVHSRLDHAEAWQAYPSDAAYERRKREKHAYLQDVADRLAETESVAVQTILIDSFDTVESLLMAAEGSDLVVMASRRRGFFGRLFSYSVTADFRSRVRIPLLLVPGYSTRVDLTRDPLAGHILVPLDGSFVAEQILEPIKALGRIDPPALTLLNVQNAEWTSGTFEHETPTGYLVATARKLAEGLPSVDAQVFTSDRPVAEVLASSAKSRNVDLIALATHADDGWQRWLRGSVLDALIKRTDLPILTLSVDAAARRPAVVTAVA
jgi:nucleotide-binding universal stress UspA family protein